MDKAVSGVVPESTVTGEVTAESKRKLKPFRSSFAVTTNSAFSLEYTTNDKRPTVYRLHTTVETKYQKETSIKNHSQNYYEVSAKYGGEARPKTAFSIKFFEDGHFLYSEPQVKEPEGFQHIEDIINDWLSFTDLYNPETGEKIYSFKRLAQAVNEGLTPIYSILTFILFTQFQRAEVLDGEERQKNKLKARPITMNDFYGSLIIAYRAGVSLELIESCFGRDEQALAVLSEVLQNPENEAKYLEGSLADPELKKAISIDFTSDI